VLALKQQLPELVILPAHEPTAAERLFGSGAPNDSTVEGQLTGPLVAADQQPVLPGTVIAVMVKATKRPVIQAVSFGAVPGRHALPCPGRDPGGQRICAVGVPARAAY
jgi:hypothetical protein